MVCTGEKGRALEMQAPSNQSLQRTWLSRLHLLPVFVCSRSGGCGVHRLSRHAAELQPLGSA
jgi:hypothetical protein